MAGSRPGRLTFSGSIYRAAMKGYTTRDIQKLLGLSPAGSGSTPGPGCSTRAAARGTATCSASVTWSCCAPPAPSWTRNVPPPRPARPATAQEAAPRRPLHHRGPDRGGGRPRGGLRRLPRHGTRRPASSASASTWPSWRSRWSRWPGEPWRAGARREGPADYWLDLGLDLEVHAPDQARRAYERCWSSSRATWRPWPTWAGSSTSRAPRKPPSSTTGGPWRRPTATTRRPRSTWAWPWRTWAGTGPRRTPTQVAILADPAFADAHYNLARVHERLGDRVSALRCLKSYRSPDAQRSCTSGPRHDRSPPPAVGPAQPGTRGSPGGRHRPGSWGCARPGSAM
jgi:hypothetical protein